MKKKILIMVIVLGILCIIVLLLIPKKDTLQTCTYQDEKVKIEVDIPKEWTYKVEEAFSGTEEFEGFPDSGIEIYINEKEEDDIYIFKQEGHINLSQDYDTEEKFQTTKGIKGILYKKRGADRVEIALILEDGFYGANMNLPINLYIQNEKDILAVLKSIKIEK